ncbi:MAG: hypothetical protein QM757_23400 [Paludibaculum sp.]
MERRSGLDQVRTEYAPAHRPVASVAKTTPGVADAPHARPSGEHRLDGERQGTTATPRQPISERRLAANRANAQKSTGPRTAEGKRRVAQNACRHNLYSKLHHLPEEIADLLYRKALEETADIADPRFRALFVHRLMLRGHERRLLQLEGKLWAEALHVNHGIIPYASLWIRENHAEVVQALGRYHAWICVRIRAIQKSIFPYVIGDVENQTGIPARTQTLLASAAGSSRSIMLATTAGTHLSSDNQFTSTGPWNPSLSGQPVETVSAQPAISNNRNLPPAGGISSLFTARRGFRPVRPVPAPQAVKAIRPPTVPGLSLRFLNRSRKQNSSTNPESPTPNHDRQGVVSAPPTAHVSKRAPVSVSSSTEQATARTIAKSEKSSSQPKTLGRRTPRSAVDALVNHPESHPNVPAVLPQERATSAQSTLPERTNPTPAPKRIPSPKPNSSTTPIPVPEPNHRPIPIPKRKRRATPQPTSAIRRVSTTTPAAPTQSNLPERTKPPPHSPPIRPRHFSECRRFCSDL